MKKSISYCYPTSPGAKKLGHEKTGCYFISKSDSPNEKIEKGHPELTREFIREFLSIDLPVCPTFQKFASPKILNALAMEAIF